MKIYKCCYILITFFLFGVAFANTEAKSPPNKTAEQMQHYIDTSKDCMIVQNKKQIVLKCGDNMIFVTSEGVGIKTPGVYKFWR
ncbi:hypothetical protein [Francisella uliginis]|uniref:Uncharacterized protein n=1 Tax=Francisella uliginis TaxID=573570 RepID=A0A1L4BU30_9GAMM|nr:hypothetical protein [Francisella uliginis]API87362.1 hypothetical protein F7310_08300 [Francisella uliginis]